jgi:hypothetical protein
LSTATQFLPGDLDVIYNCKNGNLRFVLTTAIAAELKGKSEEQAVE